MKFRKTMGLAASVLCALMLLFTAMNADVNIHVSAYGVSPESTYTDSAGIEFSYNKVDEDEDGYFDSVRINGGTYPMTAVSMEIPASIENIPVTSIAAYAFKSHDFSSITVPESVTEIGAYALSYNGRYTYDYCVTKIGNSNCSIGASALSYSVVLSGEGGTVEQYAKANSALSVYFNPKIITDTGTSTHMLSKENPTEFFFIAPRNGIYTFVSECENNRPHELKWYNYGSSGGGTNHLIEKKVTAGRCFKVTLTSGCEGLGAQQPMEWEDGEKQLVRFHVLGIQETECTFDELNGKVFDLPAYTELRVTFTSDKDMFARIYADNGVEINIEKYPKGSTLGEFTADSTEPVVLESGATYKLKVSEMSKAKNFTIITTNEMIGQYYAQDSILYKRYGDHLYAVKSLKNVTELNIPAEVNGMPVTNIAESAFSSLPLLKTVTVPSGIKEIGYWAFGNCPELSLVTIENPYCKITYGMWCATISNKFDDTIQKYNYSGVIRGYTGSEAQKYADTYNLAFESLGEIPALKGDANLDGKVDVRDCAYIARALAKGEGGNLPSNADFNDDQKINVRDAAAIARYLAEKK